MIIRKGEIKDVQSCATLITNAFGGNSKEKKKELLNKIKLRELYVAEEGKKIVGVISYTRDYSHHANYIEDIIIADNYRGKGISKLLLEKYIEISRKETPKKQKYALSSTNSKNKISIKMHLSFGFKKLGKIKGLHYGKDELIFGYNLR